MSMLRLSVLDLASIHVGETAAESFQRSRDLAQHVERWGYERFWIAEHHSMPGIASAATSLVLAHVAAATSTIRIGAGGIMLPNHSPLVIAEQFGTLATLHPGRIDLGLGRAPGSDPDTARALRRGTGADNFPEDVLELLHYFRDPEPGQRVVAVPGAGLHVPVWILGSSTFGAQLAAALGLPFAFASHFAPARLFDALEVYRSRFRPSPTLEKPHVMLGFNVFAADTDAEAELLATSVQQAFVQIRTGRPTALQPPVPGYLDKLSPGDRAILDDALSCSVMGSEKTVATALRDFQEKTGDSSRGSRQRRRRAPHSR